MKTKKKKTKKKHVGRNKILPRELLLSYGLYTKHLIEVDPKKRTEKEGRGGPKRLLGRKEGGRDQRASLLSPGHQRMYA